MATEGAENRSSRIDRDRPVWPLVAREIERDMESGALLPGARLPTENEQAAQYHVARKTVRRAIEDLRERGVVETADGRARTWSSGTE